jgi:hypothetical protein
VTATPTAYTELEGAGIHKMKMLQKMRLLEEKGTTFASTPIKELKVFGELKGISLLHYKKLSLKGQSCELHTALLF